MLKDYLQAQNMSIYKCSKDTKIPYTTLRELSLNIAPIEKTNSLVLKKLADYFSMSMNVMYRVCQIEPVQQFSIFRSQVQHDVANSEAKFVLDVVQSSDIDAYYACKMYAEAFYLLAMLDYLSDKHCIDRLSTYDRLRTQKLDSLLYPPDIILQAEFLKDDSVYQKAVDECNPYFLKYNIVERKFDHG